LVIKNGRRLERPDNENLALFTQSEVDEAVKKISKNKAVGLDCLPDNLFKS